MSAPRDDDHDVPVVLLSDDGDAEPDDDELPIVILGGVEERGEALERAIDESELLARLGRTIDAELDDELEHERADTRILSLPRAYFAAVLLIVPLLGVLFAIGRSYYALALSERPLHWLHELLRPSGSIGLSLGVFGTAMMFASMTYVVRKKLIFWRGLGAVRSWLGFHIFAGLLGPALILFHAALVPQSAMGFLGLAAMLCVVLSGVVGRYVYAFAPKSIGGGELDFDAVRRRLTVYRSKLIELGVSPDLLAGPEPNPDAAKHSPWLATAIAGLVYGDRDSRAEYAVLRDAVARIDRPPDQVRRILILARRLCRERQLAVRYGEIRKLMGAWRFLHRWLAIVMVVAIFYHVFISVRFGDLWIFKFAD